MKKRLFILPLIIVAFILGWASLGFYVDFLEINEIGSEFTKVFFKDIFAKFEMFFVLFAVVFVVATVNLLWVRKNAVRLNSTAPVYLKRKFIFLESALLAVFAASSFSSVLYRKFLLFTNSVNSGITEPIWNKDISYFFFTRDFLKGASSALFSICFIGLIINLVLYFFILADGKKENVKGAITDAGVFVHAAANVIVLFVIRGFMYYFEAQGVLLDQTGTFSGAGFTDVNIKLPFYTFAPYILFVIAAVLAICVFRKRIKASVITILVFPCLLIMMNVCVAVVDFVYVAPNEATLELPYIENNIKYTKIGFNLDSVTERKFPAEENLDRNKLEEKSDIINNIRITDPKATEEVLNSTKSIRNYYTFNDSDIIEYEIEGKPTAVNIAVREMDVTKLDANADNYINRTFRYTHGYGIMMNPVNSINSEGQPDFVIEDMPIVSKKGAPEVVEPRIYYGEKTNNYCIVNTKMNEFDYALNNENMENKYTGTESGIEMNLINRLIFAAKNMDYTMLISGYITPESRLLTNRNVLQRVKKAVPFMALDSDPYIVIDENGRLKWVVDLYTYSDQMPYAKTYGGINYIRNSAKAVVDAYLGTVDIYITDETDPIVMTYNEIYPSVMKLGGLPDDINSHIRYPEFLFNMQSEIYLRYHMTEPEIFYSNSDLWMRAKEKYRENNVIDVQPYYNLLSVEDFGREGAQLVLMMPFVPANKENLVGWLAADSYGNLICYKFPSGRTVYGTLHIENRIDSDAEISKELSLWDQGGSNVLRGNVLVIPVADSIIYVEPVYITSENQAAVPEVKRIIMAYGDRVVMRETLKECFDALFGQKNEMVDNPLVDGEIAVPNENNSDAVTAYDKMKTALQTGDWSAFGLAMEELENAINTMR